MTRKSLKGRLTKVFLRHGGLGRFTRPIDRLVEMGNEIDFQISLERDELPILVCFKKSTRWTLITTDRLIIRSGATLNTIRTLTIRTVGHRFALESFDKKNGDWLDVGLSDGTEVVLDLEPREPLFGIWNALRVFA